MYDVLSLQLKLNKNLFSIMFVLGTLFNAAFFLPFTLKMISLCLLSSSMS